MISQPSRSIMTRCFLIMSETRKKRTLDYSTLTEGAKKRCYHNVAIISSLYGWLQPDDIIKPYRLDFTSRFDSGPAAGKTLNAFWKMNVTKALVKKIQENNASEVLIPGDASKCIDWKLVKHFAKVWKIDFTDAMSNHTPTAGKLKELRGKLLRQILEDDIQDCNSLISIVSDAFVCDGTPVYPDHLHILC